MNMWQRGLNNVMDFFLFADLEAVKYLLPVTSSVCGVQSTAWSSCSSSSGDTKSSNTDRPGGKALDTLLSLSTDKQSWDPLETLCFKAHWIGFQIRLTWHTFLNIAEIKRHALIVTLQHSSIEECICVLACFGWRIRYKRVWFRWRGEERLDSTPLFKNLQQWLSAHSIPQTSIRHHQMLHNRQSWTCTLLTAFMSHLRQAI